MFKHLRGERSYVIWPNRKKSCNNTFNNEPILTSMLAAGIVLDTFAGEAGVGKGGEEETTGGCFYRYLYSSGPFLSTEFLSQQTTFSHFYLAHLSVSLL